MMLRAIRKILPPLCAVLIFLPAMIFAQDAAATPVPTPAAAETANPTVLVIVIGALAVAPFVLIMMTSFVKIAVVLAILRNAVGAPQIPPNAVLTGIALVLTIFIMAPVAERMYRDAGEIQNTEEVFSEASVRTLFEAAKRAREPLRQFMIRHTGERYRVLFRDLAQQMAVRDGDDPNEISADGFRVVIPAFVTDQLTEAFQIGFILFVPFLIIDLVVANILQAMGMFMLSPTVVSLPFKLLLFVLVSGWEIVLKNLVLGYV